MAFRFGLLLQSQISQISQLSTLSVRSVQPLTRNAFTISNNLFNPVMFQSQSSMILSPQVRLFATANSSKTAKVNSKNKSNSKKPEKKVAAKTTIKKIAAPVKKAEKPAQKDKENAVAQKEKEKERKRKELEKVAAQKEKEKAAVLKAKEKASAAAQKEKAVAQKEKEKEKKKKEAEKLSAQKEKEKIAAQKEKEKEKEKKKKEAEKLAAQKEKEKGPKRAPSARNLFMKEEYPVVRSENPSISFADASRAINRRWLELDEATKEAFRKKSSALISAFQAEREKNKRPAKGFALFMKQNFQAAKEKNPNATVPEISKILSLEYKKQKSQ